MQVSYTFSRDFISLLLKDGNVATDFGRTEVLLKGLRRVSHCVHIAYITCSSLTVIHQQS